MMDDVLIIGGGPAGLAAAMQLRRYQIMPRLFEQGRLGGLLWNANLVENYPGFLDGVPGPELVRAIVAQARGVQITHESVIELSWQDNLFQAKTPKNVYTSRLCIIASGTKHRLLTGFNIPEGLQSRVFYDVVDLLETSGEQMIIVGSGDAAFDYALNLARKNSVIILNRSEQVKCLPLLWERVKTCEKIKYHPGTYINKISECQTSGMTVECSSPHGQLDFHADYLIGAIGRDPQLDFVSNAVLERSADLEKMGILHYVGDVQNGIFRQTAIAIGDGIRAGMRIYQLVKENTHESHRFDR